VLSHLCLRPTTVTGGALLSRPWTHSGDAYITNVTSVRLSYLYAETYFLELSDSLKFLFVLISFSWSAVSPTSLSLKNDLMCVVMRCGSEKPSFRRNISLSSSGFKRRRASAVFLLILIFDPENGGDIFLRNVRMSPNYTHYNPENRTLHSNHCENFKSNKFTHIRFLLD
jgi:hypothetical protein